MKNTIKQSHWMMILVMHFFAFTVTNTYAADPPPKLTDPEKAEVARKADSVEKVKVATAKANEEARKVRPLPAISEKTIETISIMFFVVMLLLVVLFFIQAYLKNMYLGFQSIKFIGLVIMFPGICIIALVGGNLISGETLAALFGTIAGYVLSREDDSTKDALKKEKDALTKEKEDLAKANTALKTEVERLKALVP